MSLLSKRNSPKAAIGGLLDGKFLFCSLGGCRPAMLPRSPNEVKFFIKSAVFMLVVAGSCAEAGGSVPMGVVDRSRIAGEPMLAFACGERLAFIKPGDADSICLETGCATAAGSM